MLYSHASVACSASNSEEAVIRKAIRHTIMKHIKNIATRNTHLPVRRASPVCEYLHPCSVARKKQQQTIQHCSKCQNTTITLRDAETVDIWSMSWGF